METRQTRSCAGPECRGASGFTLIELVVTIALIAIMASLAVPSFVSFQQNSQLTGVANTFIAGMSAARAEAMKSNHTTYVVPAVNGVPTGGADWTVGWLVWVDMDSSGTYNNASDLSVLVGDAVPSPITTPATSGVTQFLDGSTAYVMFNGAGFPRRAGGSSVIAPPQSLDFAIGNSTASASMRRVFISSTGRMGVCKPADSGCSPGSF